MVAGVDLYSRFRCHHLQISATFRVSQRGCWTPSDPRTETNRSTRLFRQTLLCLRTIHAPGCTTRNTDASPFYTVIRTSGIVPITAVRMHGASQYTGVSRPQHIVVIQPADTLSPTCRTTISPTCRTTVSGATS